MTFDAQVRARLSRKECLYEGRREREFYRYFEPVRSLSAAGPQLCDLHDENAVRAHRPVSSPDRALTAFCQLGALRLGTRRALLFFFDSNFAYVLAEATRSLSLQDDSVHEIEDELWLGHTIIPRGFSVCEETVCKAIPRDPSDPDYQSSIIHIINDLERDRTFCNRPYVTDGPKARFYAGVPITTPKGISIGAYCCLDDKSRPDGISEKDTNFLKDMATTVMTHLEIVRAKSEHERGSAMVAGLGAFVEGASSLHEPVGQGLDRGRRKPRMTSSKVSSAMGSQPQPIFGLSNQFDGGPISQSRGLKSHSPASTDSLPVSTNPSPSPDRVDSRIDTPSDGDSLTPNATHDRERTNSTTVSRHVENLRDHIVASEVDITLQRAVHIVREAMDVEGAMFLDANVEPSGGLINKQNGGSDSTSSSEAVASGADATVAEAEDQTEGVKSLGKSCGVHAFSYATQSYDGINHQIERPTQPPNLSEKFLRSVLRRYPRGKIWNFNDKGNASSDEDSSGEPGTQESCDEPTPGFELTGGRKRKKARKQLRIGDSREVQRLFPGARSLAIVGMWDQKRERWSSACVVWTYKPLRLFSADLEVNYLSAFCDVIMAEIHRLEAQNSDKAKSDFISSISHELRSPLHGILGSVECLQDQPIDPQSATLVGQIDVCGRTLVDIVDHILEYTKISHHTRAMANSKQSRRYRGSDADRRSRLADVMTVDTIVSLDAITEEVVQATAYSFCCSRTKESILARKVTTILNIEQPSNSMLWKCHVPMGAWKRICINLVSNALKYTDEGSIRVSLKAAPMPGKRKRFNAILSVQDTGRGISRDFQDNHLFKAFSQEDTLMEGTGLGLSLVAKIVRALRGSIELQSEKWVGTTITVVVPMGHQSHQDHETKTSEIQDQRSVAGTTVGIFSFREHLAAPTTLLSSSIETNHHLVIDSLKNSCLQLGITAIAANSQLSESEYDIAILAEADFHEYQQQMVQSRTDTRDPKNLTHKITPVIVVCDNIISERQLQASTKNGILNDHVEYITQPSGPRQLAAAIVSCLQRMPKNSSSQILSGSQLPYRSSLGPPMETSHFAKSDNLGADTERASSEQKANASTRPSLNPTQSLNGDFFSLRSHSTGDIPKTPMAIALLPTSPAENLIPPDTKQVSIPEPIKAPDTGLSLLLVDDNRINLQLLVGYATKKGHYKATAADGQQAIDAFKSAWQPHLDGGKHLDHASIYARGPLDPPPPQVILMDINMPVLNGFEATRAIRSFEQHNNLPPAHIIALTGLGGVAAQQEALSAGVDLFLTKPVRLKELTKLLEGIQKGPDV